LQLADALNLDELHAARIFLKAQGDALVLGRSALESSIIRFHQTRQYLLDSLRLVLQQSTEIDDDQDDGESPARVFRNAVNIIVGKENGSGDGSAFVQKCLQSMADIKAWLQNLAEKLNSASILGQNNVPQLSETIEYQHSSLIQQHESLGVIAHYLIRGDHSKVENFESLLGVLKKVDKYDNLLG
jgi:nuclear pore complex protein Nup205